jgi:hypothetical protein
MTNWWEQAAKKAQAEMPNASVRAKEARALEIAAELERKEIDMATWRSPKFQHPAGQMVADHREGGRRLMIDAGVDPDKPLNIDWEAVPDKRIKGNAEQLGLEILSKSNGGDSH